MLATSLTISSSHARPLSTAARDGVAPDLINSEGVYAEVTAVFGDLLDMLIAMGGDVCALAAILSSSACGTGSSACCAPCIRLSG